MAMLAGHNNIPHLHPHPHHASSKLVFLLCCAGLLGAACIADFFWASSSSIHSAYRSVSANWPIQKYGDIVMLDHPNTQKKASRDRKEARKRFLSDTFADLPAPELEWEQMPSAPVPRLDGYSVQIKNLMYVFAGYGTRDYVHSHVDVYNFTDNTWCDRFDIPETMAHSHLGVATDGRYIYIVSGQYGPECRPAVTTTFSLDTETRKWRSMPPLPERRYAPATQLWKGRFHVMGGSKENRHTPGVEHWSIAVKDGEALEKEWRTEVPIPRGGPHRACVAVGDRLFVIGGQEGDFMAKPGSPLFKCSRRVEVVYGDVYMLDSEMKWKALASVPKPNSHIECAWVIVNNSIIITGGTTEKHPETHRMMLVGEVFQFHLDSLRWSVIGKLPFRIKTTLTGFWDGWLYFTSGQRDRGPDNPQPKQVIGEMWRTKLHL